MEKKLYNLLESADIDNMHDSKIGIHRDQPQFSEDVHFRVYHSDGYAFDVNKQVICEPDETKEYGHVEGLDSDGCVYSYSASWDGFKKCALSLAIELVNQEIVII